RNQRVDRRRDARRNRGSFCDDTPGREPPLRTDRYGPGYHCDCTGDSGNSGADRGLRARGAGGPSEPDCCIAARMRGSQGFSRNSWGRSLGTNSCTRFDAASRPRVINPRSIPSLTPLVLFGCQVFTSCPAPNALITVAYANDDPPESVLVIRV